jgi:hypothetical protein
MKDEGSVNVGRVRSARELLRWFSSPAGRRLLRRLGRMQALWVLSIALRPVVEIELDDELGERVYAQALLR